MAKMNKVFHGCGCFARVPDKVAIWDLVWAFYNGLCVTWYKFYWSPSIIWFFTNFFVRTLRFFSALWDYYTQLACRRLLLWLTLKIGRQLITTQRHGRTVVWGSVSLQHGWGDVSSGSSSERRLSHSPCRNKEARLCVHVDALWGCFASGSLYRTLNKYDFYSCLYPLMTV